MPDTPMSHLVQQLILNCVLRIGRAEHVVFSIDSNALFPAHTEVGGDLRIVMR
jgi:hypothetical protein